MAYWKRLVAATALACSLAFPNIGSADPVPTETVVFNFDMLLVVPAISMTLVVEWVDFDAGEVVHLYVYSDPNGNGLLGVGTATGPRTQSVGNLDAFLAGGLADGVFSLGFSAPEGSSVELASACVTAVWGRNQETSQCAALAQVPEPATGALVLLALAAVAGATRRRGPRRAT